uniref:Putative ovule protein n=1 Tax=Solanum chacoense TaxID=4108 RepID=A0A0V0IRK1_SOLCH
MLPVEVMLVSIIGRLERGDDDFCQFLFPYELINRAFEIIRPVSWRGMPPAFLVVFAAMAWLDSPFAQAELINRAFEVIRPVSWWATSFLVVFAAMAGWTLLLPKLNTDLSLNFSLFSFGFFLFV